MGSKLTRLDQIKAEKYTKIYREHEKIYFKKSKPEARHFNIGDLLNVRTPFDATSSPGTIIQQTGPNSYEVEMEIVKQSV